MIKLKKLIKELKLKSAKHDDMGIRYSMQKLQKLEDLFHGIDYNNQWESLSDISPKAKQLTTKIQKTKKNLIDLIKDLDDEIIKRKK